MDNKIKVNELAKKINASNKRVIEILNEINIFPKSTMSTLEEEEVKAFYAHIGYNADKKKPASKAAETATGDAGKNAAAPKMSGMVIRRIVKSSSSDDYYNNEANEDKAGKKNARQSTTASSGLRSGYVARSDASDASATQGAANSASQDTTVKPVVSTSDAPKIVRRVKKVDAQPKAEEPVQETKTEELVETQPVAEEKPVVTETPKVETPQAEETPVVKAEEKPAEKPAEEKPAEPVRKPSVSSEPRRGPVYISRGNPVEPRPRPGDRPARPEGRGDRPQRPEGGNREGGFNRDRGNGPRFGGQNGGNRPGGNREGGFNRGPRGPVIPQVDPALLAGQEPRRDYAGKMYEKNQEKNSKKDGKRDTSRQIGRAHV